MTENLKKTSFEKQGKLWSDSSPIYRCWPRWNI